MWVLFLLNQSVINFVATTRMPAINRQQHSTWKDYIKKFASPQFFDKSISYFLYIMKYILLSIFYISLYLCVYFVVFEALKLPTHYVISISVNILIVRKNYNHLPIVSLNIFVSLNISYEASFIKLHNTEYKLLIISCYTIVCDKVHRFKMWLI